jgi:hypothetical protein
METPTIFEFDLDSCRTGPQVGGRPTELRQGSLEEGEVSSIHSVYVHVQPWHSVPYFTGCKAYKATYSYNHSVFLQETFRGECIQADSFATEDGYSHDFNSPMTAIEEQPDSPCVSGLQQGSDQKNPVVYFGRAASRPSLLLLRPRDRVERKSGDGN